MVITGASSGIGRETAIAFAERGAAVVVAARNRSALDGLAAEIERLGGKALVAATDVALWEQVERLAQQAVDRFGRIDTWVNNAAVSEFATVEDMTVAEIERVIQVDLLGPIYGMKAALPHLRRQGQGTIINVASAEAKRAVPLQAPYVAAKHGLLGFTDTLRMELEHERRGIQITLVLPSSINTPLFAHARSRLGVRPRPIPPVYEPRTVAEAVVFAAEHPRREIFVGGAGKLLALGQSVSPSLLDRYMVSNGRLFKQQRSNKPEDAPDNLLAPLQEAGSPTGEFGPESQSVSFYTRYLELHPTRKRVAAGAAMLGAFALLRRLGR